MEGTSKIGKAFDNRQSENCDAATGAALSLHESVGSPCHL